MDRRGRLPGVIECCLPLVSSPNWKCYSTAHSGRYLKKAPDLILDQAPGVHISGGIGKEKIFDKPCRWVADNKRTGLFLAFGSEIQKGKRISDIEILDIAPTILHMFSFPVPSDMDDKVLEGIFKENSDPAKRRVEWLGVKREVRWVIKRRIESLRKPGKV